MEITRREALKLAGAVTVLGPSLSPSASTSSYTEDWIIFGDDYCVKITEGKHRYLRWEYPMGSGLCLLDNMNPVQEELMIDQVVHEVVVAVAAKHWSSL